MRQTMWIKRVLLAAAVIGLAACWTPNETVVGPGGPSISGGALTGDSEDGQARRHKLDP